MADELGSLAVSIGLDSTGFATGITGINKQLKLLDSSFKANTEALGENAKGIDGLRLKAENLSKQEELQKKKVDALQEAYNKSVESKGKDAKATQDLEIKLNLSNATLSRTQAAMMATTREIDVQRSGWTKLGKSMTEASEKLQTSGEGFGNVGSALTKGLTTPIAAIGAGLLQVGMDFDDASDKIRLGTGATGDVLDALNKDFEQVYGSVPTTMEAASTAISELNTRLGLTGKPLEDLSAQMINLARITGKDLSVSIQSATRMFQDAGISQQDYSSALDYTFRVSQQTGIGIDTLQQLMTQFGGPLRQMGFDWQTSAAMLGKFEKEGVNTALVVGSLRIALGKMAKDGIAKPNIALAEMITKIKGAGTAGEANALALDMFGAKAGPDMAAAIREGRMDLDGLITTLKDSPETINGAAEATNDFAEKFTVLKNKVVLALEPLAVDVFGAINNLVPLFEKITVKIEGFANWVAQLTPAQQEMILNFALITAALGPVLSIIGTLFTVASAITGIIATVSGAMAVVTVGATAATPAIAALAAVFTFITGPIGLAIAVIAGLAALAFVVYKNWEPISAFFNKLWTDVSTIFSATWAGIKAALLGVWNSIIALGSALWNGIVIFFANLWNGIKVLFTTAWTAIASIVMAIVTPFINGIMATWQSMQTGISSIMNGLKDILSGVWEVIKNVVLGAVLLILDLCTGNFTKLKSDAEGIFNNLKAAFGQIWEGIKQVFTGYLQAISAFMSAVWNGVSSTATTAWNALKSTVTTIGSSIVNGVVTTWNGLLAWFRGLPGQLSTIGSNMFTSMKSGVTGTISGVKNVIVNGITNAMSWITSMPSKMYNYGTDMIQGMINGIKAMVGRIGSAVSGVADKIRSYLHFSVPDEGPLTDYESWMPDFMGGLATGIEKNKFKVAQAIQGLSTDMTMGVKYKALPSTNQDMAMKTAQEVTRGVMASIQTQNQPRESSQPIQVNLHMDGAVISRQLFRLQQGRMHSLGVSG